MTPLTVPESDKSAVEVHAAIPAAAELPHIDDARVAELKARLDASRAITVAAVATPQPPQDVLSVSPELTWGARKGTDMILSPLDPAFKNHGVVTAPLTIEPAGAAVAPAVSDSTLDVQPALTSGEVASAVEGGVAQNEVVAAEPEAVDQAPVEPAAADGAVGPSEPLGASVASDGSALVDGMAPTPEGPVDVLGEDLEALDGEGVESVEQAATREAFLSGIKQVDESELHFFGPAMDAATAEPVVSSPFVTPVQDEVPAGVTTDGEADGDEPIPTDGEADEDDSDYVPSPRTEGLQEDLTGLPLLGEEPKVAPLEVHLADMEMPAFDEAEGDDVTTHRLNFPPESPSTNV